MKASKTGVENSIILISKEIDVFESSIKKKLDSAANVDLFNIFNIHHISSLIDMLKEETYKPGEYV